MARLSPLVLKNMASKPMAVFPPVRLWASAPSPAAVLAFPARRVRIRVVWPNPPRERIASSSSLDRKTPRCPPSTIRIGSQGGRNQVIETFHELSAGERLRNEGGGREAVQFLKGN
jgi:hypothetical protein